MLTRKNSVFYVLVLRMGSITGYKVVLKVILVHPQVAFSDPFGLQMTAFYLNRTGCLEITI